MFELLASVFPARCAEGGHPVADMIVAMYRGASTQLLVNGGVYDGFPIRAGVRQGYPSSGVCLPWRSMSLLSRWAPSIGRTSRRSLSAEAFVLTRTMRRAGLLISRLGYGVRGRFGVPLRWCLR